MQSQLVMKKQNMVVQVDEKVVLEYDRLKPLNKKQKEDLSRIDAKLSQDDSAKEHPGSKPNPLKSTELIACTLIKALQTGNDHITAASCAWLANRIPELRQVKVKTEDAERISIELIFNRGYQPEQTIHFVSHLH